MVKKLMLKPKLKSEIPVPKKSQTRFYSFLIYKIMPCVLGQFRDMQGQEKYFWDKFGFHLWYKYRMKYYWEKGQYIKVIICAVITLYQKEIEK